MLRFLDRLEEILIATLIAVATLVIFVAVVHRYGITLSLSIAQWGKSIGATWLFDAGRGVFQLMRKINMTWAQELCIYLFVWMAKFGAAYGARTGIHVGVDVAVKSLKPASQPVVILFALMAGALFTFIVGSLGARFVWHIAHTQQVSADLEVPMWLVYLAVPLGSYLMCFRFLQVAVSYLKTGDLPQHDHAHVEGLDNSVTALPIATAKGTS